MEGWPWPHGEILTTRYQAEYVAHISEFANMANIDAESILGDLYREMREMARKMIGL